jgi:hypothetical protein
VGKGLRKYQPLSTEDRRKFDKWLNANAILGSILAIGMLAMAVAGFVTGGPPEDTEVAAIATSPRQ